MCPQVLERPRLVFVINSIGTGGAERALETILARAGKRLEQYDIHLVLLDREAERRQLPGVHVKHVLDAGGRLVASIRQLDRLLRKLRPDLVVSLLVRANVATALIGRRSSAATVICERMHLSAHLAGRYRGLRLFFLRLLIRLTYRRASHVLAVTEGARADLVERFGVPGSRASTVHNGYDLELIDRAAAEPPCVDLPDAYILAVGRLVEAKGFSLLIDAYARSHAPYPLLILGEGPQGDRIREQIRTRGLQERVRLLGFVDEPFPIMSRATFLVSASRNEGFPNALAEAMALARPVISTDCPSGPAELLGACAGEAGEVVEAPYGLIVRDGDEAGLAEAIRLMSDPARRSRLGAAARSRMEEFRADKVTEQYWALFDRHIAHAGPAG
jgi:glycosyltransferase involved in cell wall biosynthesis